MPLDRNHPDIPGGYELVWVDDPMLGRIKRWRLKTEEFAAESDPTQGGGLSTLPHAICSDTSWWRHPCELPAGHTGNHKNGPTQWGREKKAPDNAQDQILRLAQALRLIRDTCSEYPSNVADRALREAGIEDPDEETL